jgi:electron transfer flavoprotein beta subunit
MTLNIVVCIKQVINPDYFEGLTLDPETGSIRRENVPSILNPVDENALEEALRIKDQFEDVTITAISMGPPQADEILQWALALGCDQAVLLCDRAFAGADSLATAFTLATAIRKLGNVDLVLCGNEAADGATQQVGPQIAELLGIPHATYIAGMRLENDKTVALHRVIEYGHLEMTCRLPMLVAVLGEINQPRQVTADGLISAMDTEMTTWDAIGLGVSPEQVGLKASPTWVEGSYEKRIVRAGLMLEGTPAEMVKAAVSALHEDGLL